MGAGGRAAGIFAEEVIPLLERELQLRAVTIFEELLGRHPILIVALQTSAPKEPGPVARPA